VTEVVDTVVIGAGVIGLAIARTWAKRGHDVLVLERAPRIGSEISSRNSEVIHAGIYYPSGSLKATLCVAGRSMLYEYCETHHVPHRRCGKLIVASDRAEIPTLEQLLVAANRNGVSDLRWLSAAEAIALEPNLACVAALHSPSTGIVDSHALMTAFLGEAEDHGAQVARETRFERAAVRDDRFVVSTVGRDGQRYEISAHHLVNAAGLGAQDVATAIDAMPLAFVPKRFLAKGNYFRLVGTAPFSRLVYPVPEPGGLGVHLTLDLGGQARFGPDVEWIETIDYGVQPGRGEKFYRSIRRYFPALAHGQLVPDYAGIRPKISAPGAPNADFVIQDATVHGVLGLINLFGIESPGLTASIAIADRVAERLAQGA